MENQPMELIFELYQVFTVELVVFCHHVSNGNYKTTILLSSALLSALFLFTVTVLSFTR
jgi:hypothetical protein